MFNLTDYNLVSQPRSCCGHGGLMVYVHNQFKCTPINNKIMKKATGWEYLCVEISHQKNVSKNYIILRNRVKCLMSLTYFWKNLRHF